MTTYCWKFWKFCLNLKDRTRSHKIRRLRAEQLHESFCHKNLSFISSRRKGNSQFIEKHDSFSHFCFSIAIRAKKPTESWHKAVKNMSKPSKTLASDKRSLHASLKLLWRLTKMSASFQAICWAICWPLGFSYKTRENQQLNFNDTDVGFCKQRLGLLTLLALLV